MENDTINRTYSRVELNVLLCDFMRKFMVDYSEWNVRAEIEEVSIERETDKSVWVGGYREAKVSKWHNYFDTLEEAKQQLVEWQSEIVDLAQARMKTSEIRLMDVKALGVIVIFFIII